MDSNTEKVKNLTHEELKELRKYLPRSYAKTIAEKCNCKRYYVIDVMNFKLKQVRKDVLLEIIRFATENKKSTPMQEIENAYANFKS